MNNDNEKSNLQIPEEKKQQLSTLSTAENTHTPITRKSPIISFTGRKKRRFSFRRLIIPLLSFFLAFCLLTFYAEKLLAERFPELAKSQGEKVLSDLIYSTVEKMADDGLLSYSSMVKTIRDPSGEVIYLEVDTAMLARASARLVQCVDDALNAQKRITLSVPMGSLGGWTIFSGLGIPVWAQIYPVGNTKGSIYTVLEDCGINQTRHLIRVDISAKFLLILPTENIEVKTEISLPLGERVLVGDVPEIYLDNIGGN